MATIRSKRLYLYLLERNIDFEDSVALAQAKADYRKQYKKNWKQQSKKHRELRPTFTEAEYIELCKRADLLGLTPTAYLRELILTNQENRKLIPHKEILLQVLQRLSMAINQSRSKHLSIQMFQEAEHLLLEYINNQNFESFSNKIDKNPYFYNK